MSQYCTKLVFLLYISSLMPFALAVKVNLTSTCAGEQLYACSLTDLVSLIEDPLEIVNSSAPNLTELIIHHSHIKRISTELFELVPALQIFRIYKCQLNRIWPDDLKYAKNLQEFLVQTTPLTEIPEKLFNHTQKLITLQLGYNHISMVHRNAFAGLKQLRYLDMQGNSIETLPDAVFSSLPQLEHIDLSGNRLEKIDGSTFATNTNLKTVLLSGNPFRIFESNSFEHLGRLHLLDLNGVKGLDELSVQSVDTLLVQGSGLQKLSISGEVITLNAANNKLSTLNIGNKLAVRELNLQGNLFNSLDALVGMRNLQKLIMSKNLLRSLNSSQSSLVLALPSLTYLDLSFNQLKKLSSGKFLMLQKLAYLDLAFNHLTGLPAKTLEPLISLEYLYIEGNYLQKIDYEGLLNVRNTLKEVGLSNTEWDARYQSDVLNFFKEHGISLPVRYTQALTHTGCSLGNIATTKSLYDLMVAERPPPLEQVAEVSGIHPYWTTRDILAFATLLVCLFIMFLQLCHILREEHCFSRCCERIRNGNADMARLPLNDAENYTEL